LIKEVLPKLHASLSKSKGDLLLSGILIFDKEDIISSAEKAGFSLIKFKTEDEWIAFHFKIINN